MYLHEIVKKAQSRLCINFRFTPSLSSFHFCLGFIFLTPYLPLYSRLFLLLAHFDDTSWGVYCRHEAARIQFYSFDGTVRNLPFSLLLFFLIWPFHRAVHQHWHSATRQRGPIAASFTDHSLLTDILKKKKKTGKKMHFEIECAATSILAKPSELRPTGFNSSWRQNRLFRCH